MDDHWIQHCLNQLSGDLEVPIAACIVKDDVCLATTVNQVLTQQNPCAHAEILALQKASKTLGNYRLTGTTLYVTLQPCLMCLGAMVHARIDRLVYGARDPKKKCLEQEFEALHQQFGFNHRFEVQGGVCEQPCQQILQQFFKERRV